VAWRIVVHDGTAQVRATANRRRKSAPFARIQRLAVLADLALELLAIAGAHLTAAVIAATGCLAKIGGIAIAPDVLAHRPLPAATRIVATGTTGSEGALPLRQGDLAGKQQSNEEKMREALHG
jgi:hypothetical protein